MQSQYTSSTRVVDIVAVVVDAVVIVVAVVVDAVVIVVAVAVVAVAVVVVAVTNLLCHCTMRILTRSSSGGLHHGRNLHSLA